ncbi:MAG: hypothetical protein M1150_02940 [Patescibacteria group bacterium]|nr:hypothetical protein [Patescibacteria group bacterium]
MSGREEDINSPSFLGREKIERAANLLLMEHLTRVGAVIKNSHLRQEEPWKRQPTR